MHASTSHRALFSSAVARRIADDHAIAPGYVDLQVNGYADVDFNADELAVEDVARVCQRLRDDGVAGILATVVTADLDAMCRRLANICRVRDEDRPCAR